MEDLKIFESLPQVMLLVKADTPRFTLLAASAGYRETVGRSTGDCMGMPYFECLTGPPAFIPVSLAAIMKSSFEYVLSHNLPNTLESTSAGGVFNDYSSVQNQPITNGAGEVAYILQTFSRGNANSLDRETELRKEINKTAELFRQAPVAICIVKGPAYVFEMVNEEMLEFLGRTAAIIGKPLMEVLPESKLQGLVAMFDKVLETGEACNISTFPAEILIDGVREKRYFDVKFQLYNPSIDPGETRIFCVAHNVTGQVLARKKLEEVQEKLSFRNALFEAMNEATPDGILVVDTAGEILLHNKRFDEIWEIPRSLTTAGAGKEILNFARAMLADPGKFPAPVNNVRTEQALYQQDAMLLKNGRVVESHGVQIMSEANVSYGWAWYFRDTTDRIRQEQKFNNVVQQASTPILILKGENMVLEVANNALFELWNVTDEAVGKPLLEILPEMEEQGIFDLLQGVFRTGEAFYGSEIPIYFERSTGQKETIYFNFSYQPYREADGTTTGVLVLANDVTGQVMAKHRILESERNLRNTILQAPVAMCLLKGPEFKVDIANKRMIDFWGKTSSEVLNKPIFQGVSEAQNQGFEDLLKKVYYTGETVSGYGTPINLSRNGELELVYVNFVYEPFREWNGEISGIMVVIMEVTEQVLAKKQLEATEQELQRRVYERTIELDNINIELKQSNLNLEEFAYAASHDLKSPIRKINVLSERLSRELEPLLNESQARIFTRIQDAATRMLSLIDDLLTFSQISKGRGEWEDIDLNQKVKKVLEDLDLEVNEKKATILVDRMPVVRGNRRQLQQLFQNLVSNALKYSRSAVVPEVKITARRVKGAEVPGIFSKENLETEYNLIQVKDNGIGFEQKDAEQIFKVFTRLLNATEYSGTGVGLSIVKRVVENHNGHIWAESSPGNGALFSILFPVEAIN